MDNNWTDRVREELNELDARIGRLCNFLLDEEKMQDFPDRHRRLLRKQLDAMGIYEATLTARLTLFGSRESQERDSQNRVSTLT